MFSAFSLYHHLFVHLLDRLFLTSSCRLSSSFLQVQRQRPAQGPGPVLGQVGPGERAGPRGVGQRGAGEERGERQRHVGAPGRLVRGHGPQRGAARDALPGAEPRGAGGGGSTQIISLLIGGRRQ